VIRHDEPLRARQDFRGTLPRIAAPVLLFENKILKIDKLRLKIRQS